jgi:hypothetical protein
VGAFKDLTGQTFGRLYVVGLAKDRVSKSGSHSFMWACICNCGGEHCVKAISRGNLVKGTTKSCGCIAKEQNFKDLTGQRFGRWTVIEFAYIDKWRSANWKCICDCGTERIVDGCILRSGDSTSCGCYHKERVSEASLIDLTGRQFGRWLVLGRAKNKGQTPYWTCKCDCGTVREVHGSHLRGGLTKSCGCWNREIAASSFHDLTGKQFHRWTVIRQEGRNKFNEITWLCQCVCGTEKILKSQALVSGVSKSCGCYKSEVMTRIHSGENNNHWNGGITELTNKIRTSKQYKYWRDAIFKRDNYRGPFGDEIGVLVAHHIKPFHLILKENNIDTWEQALLCEELWDVNNGITLLEEHHSIDSDNPRAFHKIYSNFSTEAQFYDWLAEGKVS